MLSVLTYCMFSLSPSLCGVTFQAKLCGSETLAEYGVTPNHHEASEIQDENRNVGYVNFQDLR